MSVGRCIRVCAICALYAVSSTHLPAGMQCDSSSPSRRMAAISNLSGPSEASSSPSRHMAAISNLSGPSEANSSPSHRSVAGSPAAFWAASAATILSLVVRATFMAGALLVVEVEAEVEEVVEGDLVVIIHHREYL
jgi:hypothetical protein